MVSAPVFQRGVAVGEAAGQGSHWWRGLQFPQRLFRTLHVAPCGWYLHLNGVDLLMLQHTFRKAFPSKQVANSSSSSSQHQIVQAGISLHCFHPPPALPPKTHRVPLLRPVDSSITMGWVPTCMILACVGTFILSSLNHHFSVIHSYQSIEHFICIHICPTEHGIECTIGQLFSDWFMSPFFIASISHALDAAQFYFPIPLPVLKSIPAYMLPSVPTTQ